MFIQSNNGIITKYYKHFFALFSKNIQLRYFILLNIPLFLAIFVCLNNFSVESNKTKKKSKQRKKKRLKRMKTFITAKKDEYRDTIRRDD